MLKNLVKVSDFSFLMINFYLYVCKNYSTNSESISCLAQILFDFCPNLKTFYGKAIFPNFYNSASQLSTELGTSILYKILKQLSLAGSSEDQLIQGSQPQQGRLNKFSTTAISHISISSPKKTLQYLQTACFSTQPFSK